MFIVVFMFIFILLFSISKPFCQISILVAILQMENLRFGEVKIFAHSHIPSEVRAVF